MISGRLFPKCMSKPDRKIRKFKTQYCARSFFEKILSREPLNSYSSVVQWATVRLILILQWYLGLQSQIIDFTNAFSQTYIRRGDPVIIELTRDFKSDGGQCDIVLRLKKILYGQAVTARLWYERLQNGLLDPCFVIR